MQNNEMRAIASTNAITTTTAKQDKQSEIKVVIMEIREMRETAQKQLNALLLEREEEMQAAAEKRKKGGSGRCFKCKKPGHRANVCPLKGNAQPLHLQSWMRL